MRFLLIVAILLCSMSAMAMPAPQCEVTIVGPANPYNLCDCTCDLDGAMITTCDQDECRYSVNCFLSCDVSTLEPCETSCESVENFHD